MRCLFLPPYLVQHLATLKDPQLTSTTEETLRLDGGLRSSRAAAPRTMQRPARGDDATRVIHDARGREQLPGDVVRRDDDPPTGDEAVDEAFLSAGLVWDLFADAFGRRSVDGNGTPLSVTVHYGQRYDNAFWNGEQLVFGDGDGEIFESFTRPPDVLAHEFTHGVTQFTAGLAYQGQPGALNESVSDVFAALTRQRALDQRADQADWLIGVGIFRPGVRARALRSMIEPGTAYDDPRLGRDPQVGSMADFVDTEEDSGGVHLNSGIPNRAFALAARALGGHSWERAGRIWYEALTSGEVDARTDFAGFAAATVAAASRSFPGDAAVESAVAEAWAQVGVATGRPPAPEQSAPTANAQTQLVAVRRTGGFTGLPRTGRLDLDRDPDGPEVRLLLGAVDFAALAPGAGAPDRFEYSLEYGEVRLTLPEQDLTPELRRVVQLVLSEQNQRLDL